VVPLSGFSTVQAVGAVWQLLATVTLQRFIADINNRLTRLEAGVAEIKSWFEGEQLALLTGNIRYLRNIQQWITTATPSSVEATVLGGQLEAIDREANRSMEFMRRQLEGVLGAIAAREVASRGLAENSRAVSELITRYERWSRALLAAAAIKGLCAQLRCALLYGRELALIRIEGLRTDLHDQERLHREFHRVVLRRIRTLRSRWSRASTILEQQELLRRLLKETSSSIRKQALGLHEAIETTAQNLKISVLESERVALVVDRDDQGGIRKIGRLVESLV
jgi:hypothetical protein